MLVCSISICQAAVRMLAFRADKDKAAKALEKVSERYKELRASRKRQEARDFGLALVEMLIYQVLSHIIVFKFVIIIILL